MNETDKAYIAGLLDGDGSIGWQYAEAFGTPTRYLRVRIFNTHLGVLEWCKLVSGLGKISVKYLKKYGYPYGTWLVCSEDGRALLREIVPYLKIKVEEAKEAI